MTSTGLRQPRGPSSLPGIRPASLVHLSPPGVSLGCATLQWLLAENAAADIIKAQALSSVQGVAPDGTDVHLIIREASRGQLSCPGGTLASTAAVLSRVPRLLERNQILGPTFRRSPMHPRTRGRL